MFKHTTKKLLLASLASFTFLGATSLAFAQELHKTPDLNKAVSADASTVADIQMPADYPSELATLTEDTRSYVVVDQDTHNILAAKDATKPYPIASMSKIMAAYLVYKAVEDGKIKLEDKVKAPEAIVTDLTKNPDLSNAGLVTDAEYTVQELLHGVLLASGNDATTLLMQHIYGSEQEGVKAIRAQLTEWGIDNYEFYTSSGIPNKYIPESYWFEGSTKENQNTMSAADVALMAQYAIEKYPQMLEVASTREYTIQKGTPNEVALYNNNLLLEGAEYGRPGVTGLKSGYTEEAGKCFVTVSTENNRKIIAVVMGIQEPYNSYQETGIILDGLAKHPELYQLAGLTSNKLPTQAEKEAEAAKKAAEEAAAKAQQAKTDGTAPTDSLPARRHSPFTDFMRKIFSIFG